MTLAWIIAPERNNELRTNICPVVSSGTLSVSLNSTRCLPNGGSTKPLSEALELSSRNGIASAWAVTLQVLSKSIPEEFQASSLFRVRSTPYSWIWTIFRSIATRPGSIWLTLIPFIPYLDNLLLYSLAWIQYNWICLHLEARLIVRRRPGDF